MRFALHKVLAIFAVHALGGASDDIIWHGGGVSVFANYSYVATLGPGSGVTLTGGAYGMMCDGELAKLTPVGHTVGIIQHAALGPMHSVTVSLVASASIGSAAHRCNGTRADATFSAVPWSPSAAAVGDGGALADGDGVVFSLAFPDGVEFNGTGSTSSAATSGAAAASAMATADRVSGAVAGRAPTLPPGHATAFPLFASPLGADSDTGSTGSTGGTGGTNRSEVAYLTWRGEFSRALWGAGAAGALIEDGAPIVVFDGSVAHGDGAVLSTVDEHFTSKCHLSIAGFGCGVAAAVARLAPGYSSSALLRLAHGGVTAAVMGWGDALQRLHNASKRTADGGSPSTALAATDLVTTRLGYWTDNMAYYDWYHWFPNVTREGTPQDVLLALDAEMEDKNLSVAYYQLDAYWYHLEIKPAYCVVSWDAVNEQFPKGLAWLSAQLGKPLLLYTDTWCNDTVYRTAQGGKYRFMDGDRASLSWFDGYTANVVPEDALSFYRDIMAQGKRQGMGAFEVDFLDYNFNLYPRFRSEPGAHAAWLDAMDAAAREVGVSIQYCMTLPQQLLHSLSLPQVTSSRVSPDGGRPYYNGAPGHLLAAALGVRPFKDNAWTSGAFPKGEADVVGAVLSRGPVGLADRLHSTNATLAAAACARDGTLLHPSRPATPLDTTYLPDGSALMLQGNVMSAHYGPESNAKWYVIAATGTKSGTSVAPADLWPVPSTAGPAVWWHAAGHPGSGESCAPGAATAKCLHSFGADSPVPAAAGPAAIELYHVAPVLAGRWVLLGETDKIVPVAAARFSAVRLAASGESLELDVAGSVGEQIEISFASWSEGPADAAETDIMSKTVILGGSGNATVTIP